MYEQFFGLTERPFDLTPNPRYLFLTAAYREALSNLAYGLNSRKGLTVVTGEAGTGKTTLLTVALAQWCEQGHLVATLRNPTMERGEFLQFLAESFGLSERAAASKTVMLGEFEQLLRQRHAKGLLTALVIDEAHSLPTELLEEVRLLANIETHDTKLLPLVLLGQPELADRLNDPSLRQLKQRVALRCSLEPLNVRETAAYVAKRIQLAGGDSLQLFTREAIEGVHRGSGGIPRLINVICDNALVGAMAAEVKPVTQSIVREVCLDFDLPVLPAPDAATPQVGAPTPAGAEPTGWHAGRLGESVPPRAAAPVGSHAPLPRATEGSAAAAAAGGVLAGARVIPITPGSTVSFGASDDRTWFSRLLRWPARLFRPKERA
ncbi:MAG TPA: AAA family ATPase [Luteitalea sp.]|nr:AAA family ATPase [Luteitalea sp.]